MNWSIIALLLIVAVIILAALYIATREKTEAQEKHGPEYYRLDNLCNEIRKSVDDVVNEDFSEFSLSSEELEKREESKARLNRNTREACQGDEGQRNYVKEHIRELLQKREGVDARTVNFVIPFNNPDEMTPQDKFEYMYACYKDEHPFRTFEAMCRTYGWDEPKLDSKGNEIFCITGEDVNKSFDKFEDEGLFENRINMVTQRIYQRLYGLSVADILIMDDSIDTVHGGTGGVTFKGYDYLKEINDEYKKAVKPPHTYDSLYIVFHGKLMRMEFLSFGDMKTLKKVTSNVYRYNCRKVLCKKDPVIQSSMKNGARVMVTQYPASPTYGFYVRKFDSSNAKDMRALFTDKGSEKVCSLLKMIAIGEINCIITGDTGTGKTTTLKAMVVEMNPNYCVRSVEHAFELGLNNLVPDRNIMALQEHEGYSICDALRDTKRMEVGYLILGEVNEPECAGIYIQIGQSGSRCVITTSHHKDTDKLLDYFRNSLMACEHFDDPNAAMRQVLDCMRFDIHMNCDRKGHYYVERVTEIIPREPGEYPVDTDEATREFYRRMTEIRPYEKRDVLKYDVNNCEYVFANRLSEESEAKIMENCGEEGIEFLKMFESLERR